MVWELDCVETGAYTGVAALAGERALRGVAQVRRLRAAVAQGLMEFDVCPCRAKRNTVLRLVFTGFHESVRCCDDRCCDTSRKTKNNNAEPAFARVAGSACVVIRSRPAKRRLRKIGPALFYRAGPLFMAPVFIKPINSLYSMMPWPLTPPVVLAPGRAEEEEEEEVSACAAGADVDEDAVELVLALPALDERDAQPASVAPMAIIEIRTEILMFLGSVFMAKYLVS